MHLFAFILIGGIWAAFLLPSLLDGRRQAPMTSTRSFARSQDLLASVATSDARHLLQRRRNSLRRRRTLAALGAGAALALVLAIIQSSSMWLYVAIGFDVALAAYVTLLLSSQQASPHRATVVALPTADEPRYEYENASVRIVAG
jgi:hypothetical protein